MTGLPEAPGVGRVWFPWTMPSFGLSALSLALATHSVPSGPHECGLRPRLGFEGALLSPSVAPGLSEMSLQPCFKAEVWDTWDNASYKCLTLWCILFPSPPTHTAHSPSKPPENHPNPQLPVPKETQPRPLGEAGLLVSRESDLSAASPALAPCCWSLSRGCIK